MSSSSTRVPASGDQAAAPSQPSEAQPTEPQASLGKIPSFIHHPPDLARHRRKCSICRHPERETIEDLFIHWHSPNTIANYFDDTADDAEDAGDESANRLRITWVAIYRHAYAVGLDEVRRRNLRFAFEHILEQAGDITPTSASIMAAARAYAACVNGTGQWNDPPKQVIVTNILKRETETPFTARDARTSRRESDAAISNVIPNPAAPFADGGEGPAVALASSPLTDHGTRPSAHVIPNPAASFADGGEGPAVAAASVPPCIPDCDSDIVAAGLSRQPSAPAPLTEHRSRITAPESIPASVPPYLSASDPRAEIRIPPNPLITNDRQISNR